MKIYLIFSVILISIITKDTYSQNYIKAGAELEQVSDGDVRLANYILEFESSFSKRWSAYSSIFYGKKDWTNRKVLHHSFENYGINIGANYQLYQSKQYRLKLVTGLGYRNIHQNLPSQYEENLLEGIHNIIYENQKSHNYGLRFGILNQYYITNNFFLEMDLNYEYYFNQMQGIGIGLKIGYNIND